MNSTHAVRTLLVLSLAANVALGWKLWQDRTEPLAPSIPPPALTDSMPKLEVKPVNLLTLPAAAPAQAGFQPVNLLLPTGSEASDTAPDRTSSLLEVAPRKAYGPPPPPNPHAFPPWPERLPYRETQIQRGLYSTPLKLDKE